MAKHAICIFSTIFVMLVAMSGIARGQHYTDWTGFEYEQLNTMGFSVSTQFYELTKDYTISLPDYFGDASALPASCADEVDFYQSWATVLPTCDWDFVSIEPGGILTVKKGYRWDGPSYPCFLGIEIMSYNIRSSMVHDVLYDLMRMGYLESDTWDPGDNNIDPDGVNNAGDHNRRMADMMIYMIGVEDGQTVGDGNPLAFGTALTDYKILRTVGRSATHNNEKLTDWKYHSAKLTAYASDGQVELSWDHPDMAARDPNFWEHFNPFAGYEILRNGQPYMAVECSGTWPNVPVFPVSWVDNTVVNDSTYTYQVIPDERNTNQYDWTNTEVVTPVSLSGKALVLDGINDYVEANPTANDLVFSVTPEILPIPLTMEAWVYPEPQAGSGAIFAFNTISGDNENILFYSGDSLKFYYFDPATSNVISAVPSVPNEWYHVAVTIEYITGQGTLYIDGEPQATFTTSVRPGHGSQFSIGQEWDNAATSNHFKGRIDEVRIWKDARSQGEIQAAMNTPLRGDESGLIGLWHFDDPNDLFVPIAPPSPDSTRKAYEATVNASDGTLHGYDPSDTPFVTSGAMGQVVAVDDENGEAGDESAMNPKSFAIHQNYPNPFNPSTVIKFDVPKRSHVTITVFNTLGQRVKELVDEEYSAGDYEVTWDGRDENGALVSSGMYFYTIEAGDFTGARKMILLK